MRIEKKGYVYVADDGREFDYQSDCENYENMLRGERFLDTFPSIDIGETTWFKIETEEDFNELLNCQKSRNRGWHIYDNYESEFEKGWYCLFLDDNDVMVIEKLDTVLSEAKEKINQLNKKIENTQFFMMEVKRLCD